MHLLSPTFLRHEPRFAESHLDFGPLLEQLVVMVEETGEGGMVGMVGPERLDGFIEFKEHHAPAIIANEALNPEKGCDTGAAGDWGDLVQAGSGVEDGMSGRKLHRHMAVGIHDAKLATIVFSGVGEEDGHREVGP